MGGAYQLPDQTSFFFINSKNVIYWNGNVILILSLIKMGNGGILTSRFDISLFQRQDFECSVLLACSGYLEEGESGRCYVLKISKHFQVGGTAQWPAQAPTSLCLDLCSIALPAFWLFFFTTPPFTVKQLPRFANDSQLISPRSI